MFIKSGDPRTILPEYLIKYYNDDVTYYLPQLTLQGFKYLCQTSSNGGVKRVLADIPADIEVLIQEQLELAETPFIIFSCITTQKAECSEEPDNRSHSLTAIYNRYTGRIFIYDLLRFYYRGFRINTVKTRFGVDLEEFIEENDKNNKYVEIENNNYKIKTEEVLTNKLLKHVKYVLANKYGKTPSIETWYSVLINIEMHIMFMFPHMLPKEIEQHIIDMPEDELIELFEDLLAQLSNFINKYYEKNNLKCLDLNEEYDPELNDCIANKTSKKIKVSKELDIKSKPSVESLDSNDNANYRMGRETGQIGMLMYFDQNYKRTSVFLPKKKKVINKSDYTLLWYFNNDKNTWELEIPKYFIGFIKKSIKNPNYDSAIILIRLKSKASSDKEAGNHLNALFYNRLTNEIEHFEPHGKSLGVRYAPSKLYQKLKGVFKELIPDVTYLPPSNICLSRKTFFQFDENLNEISFDFIPGTCAIWNMWYLDVRLSNPSFTRDEAIDGAIQKLKKKGSLSLFINNYQKYYMHMIKYIFETEADLLDIEYNPEKYIPKTASSSDSESSNSDNAKRKNKSLSLEALNVKTKKSTNKVIRKTQSI